MFMQERERVWTDMRLRSRNRELLCRHRDHHRGHHCGQYSGRHRGQHRGQHSAHHHAQQRGLHDIDCDDDVLVWACLIVSVQAITALKAAFTKWGCVGIIVVIILVIIVVTIVVINMVRAPICARHHGCFTNWGCGRRIQRRSHRNKHSSQSCRNPLL